MSQLQGAAADPMLGRGQCERGFVTPGWLPGWGGGVSALAQADGAAFRHTRGQPSGAI